MRRVLALAVLVAAFIAPLVSNHKSVSAQKPPDGIPSNAEFAEVTSYEDGVKFKVKLDGESHTVLLISADAPEKGECYFKESSAGLKKFLPRGTDVWLELDTDDKDSKDRLLRYAWIVREDGKVQLVDERMVALGYSTFKAREDNNRYDSRIEKAMKVAKEKDRGLWKACGGGHVEATKAPEATKALFPGDKELPAQIGTSVGTDGQSITITEAFFSYDYGYAQPKGGYILLVLSVRIENNDPSGDKHGYEESRFTAENVATGADFVTTFTFADQPLGSGELSPGEFVFGTVVLEVQDVTGRIRIEYDPSYLGGGEVYWFIDL